MDLLAEERNRLAAVAVVESVEGEERESEEEEESVCLIFTGKHHFGKLQKEERLF